MLAQYYLELFDQIEHPSLATLIADGNEFGIHGKSRGQRFAILSVRDHWTWFGAGCRSVSGHNLQQSTNTDAPT